MSHVEDPTITAQKPEAQAETPVARPKIVLKPKATAAAVIHQAQATGETRDGAAEPDAAALEKLASARRERAARLKGIHNPTDLPEPPIVPEQHNAHVAPPEDVAEMAYAPPAAIPQATAPHVFLPALLTNREEPLGFSPQSYNSAAADTPNARVVRVGKSKEVPFGTLSVARSGPGMNIMAMNPARQFGTDCAARISDAFQGMFDDTKQQKRFEYFIKEALGSRQVQLHYEKQFSRFPNIFPDLLVDAVQSQVLSNIQNNEAALESHRFLLQERRNGYVLNPQVAHAVRDFATECLNTVALPEPERSSQRGGSGDSGRGGRR